MNPTPQQEQEQESPEEVNKYFELIDKLLNCPNGQEPEVLEDNLELLDAGLIKTMLKVAAIFVHEDNSEGAEFLVHIARELSKQLGLYPEIPAKE
ncbi:hypothetical protein DSM106972_024240 [Dulcicalothrix desertica PCC 7102]|uniref:Uncharacterized protein n=1 Tax=Dulcicalothrix desertica PCC 7102 TaxID=232991 RepID=A0A433VM07_9CYAN|nr:hypothetical protein [Dulcicalothrix desertica]RUT07163.1 hypothetical protein DSM106972_024240 [Dulcicalothrix desertica PCC 7102]TWH61842.1 hypothetical protein CAL7102_00519 [Dulcicalothrix desertica PCC 7102]